MSIWDDPDMQPNDTYIRFEHVGDEVTGAITNITKRTFADGKNAAEFTLDTARGLKRMIASQSQLQRLMWNHKPDLGDTITVRFDSLEKMAGGMTRKLFTLHVKRAGTDVPMNKTSGQPNTWPKLAPTDTNLDLL